MKDREEFKFYSHFFAQFFSKMCYELRFSIEDDEKEITFLSSNSFDKDLNHRFYFKKV